MKNYRPTPQHLAKHREICQREARLYLTEQMAVLQSMDLDRARVFAVAYRVETLLPWLEPDNEDVLLAVLHYARTGPYPVAVFPQQLVIESVLWLEEHGYRTPVLELYAGPRLHDERIDNASKTEGS